MVGKRIVPPDRDVNEARSVKVKASRPRPETCKAKATDSRPMPSMQK